jgi:DNA-binding response OmpR family regulator
MILILDDDLGFVMWLGKVLAMAGYQALPATDGNEALALVRELKIEIALLIANLLAPGYLAVVAALNRQRIPPHIIAITDADTTGAGGIDGVLRKPHSAPWPEQDYVETVRRVFAGKGERQTSGA